MQPLPSYEAPVMPKLSEAQHSFLSVVARTGEAFGGRGNQPTLKKLADLGIMTRRDEQPLYVPYSEYEQQRGKRGLQFNGKGYFILTPYGFQVVFQLFGFTGWQTMWEALTVNKIKATADVFRAFVNLRLTAILLEGLPMLQRAGVTISMYHNLFVRAGLLQVDGLPGTFRIETSPDYFISSHERFHKENPAILELHALLLQEVAELVKRLRAYTRIVRQTGMYPTGLAAAYDILEHEVELLRTWPEEYQQQVLQGTWRSKGSGLNWEEDRNDSIRRVEAGRQFMQAQIDAGLVDVYNDPNFNS